MTTITTAEMTTGSVVSKDGTCIGFLRVGRGPAVVLLHGSNESARSHTQLALALADTFTVYLPDRRGRGISGPHCPDHRIRTEVEDLQAVLAESGAQRVFGVSVSALIVLEAARTHPAIRKIAAYEPALLMDATTVHRLGAPLRPGDGPGQGRGRADHQHVRAGPGPASLQAHAASAGGSPHQPGHGQRGQAGRQRHRHHAQLAPTLRWEGMLLAEMAGTIGSFADVPAEVLLLGGDMERPAFIRPAFDALAQTLPHNRRMMFPGLEHGGSADVGPANPGGKPEVVAPAIRSFFAQP